MITEQVGIRDPIEERQRDRSSKEGRLGEVKRADWERKNRRSKSEKEGNNGTGEMEKREHIRSGRESGTDQVEERQKDRADRTKTEGQVK